MQLNIAATKYAGSLIAILEPNRKGVGISRFAIVINDYGKGKQGAIRVRSGASYTPHAGVGTYAYVRSDTGGLDSWAAYAVINKIDLYK